MTDLNDLPTALSTSALEVKLKDLREKSNKHSQILTAKLASSQSGQNLLHIGTSLSTLPPDLHSLLTQLHPVLSSAESTEKKYLQHLQRLVHCGNEVRIEQRKVEHAKECAENYQDLLAAEMVVKRDASYRMINMGQATSSRQKEQENSDASNDLLEMLDHISSLERCAHTTIFLVQDLQSSTDKLSALTARKIAAPAGDTNTNLNNNSALPSMKTPLEDDTERAQFLMKLAPRVRQLESDTVTSLTRQMEDVLQGLQQRRERGREAEDEEAGLPKEEVLLVMIGHCMRGLALLGRGKEVESVFARVAIMPLIRSKVSMGRLDEGGSRGECAGLLSLLDEIATSVVHTFGPVLRLAEAMFDVGPTMEVDLITAGVWVPIATALLADAGIKMAIFSPGIASILQANYVALDTFLAELGKRLLEETQTEETEQSSNPGVTAAGSITSDSLHFCPSVTAETIQRAQGRIYAHPKTADFSKKWNLPIYYQLRFGECCNRLNNAAENTRRGGWVAAVFTGDDERAEWIKTKAGFELPLFLELYDMLLSLWRSDVMLRPLTHRFLRGAVQLVGRTVAFIRDGMEGKVLFGVDKSAEELEENGNNGDGNGSGLPYLTRTPYCWGDSEQDVAAVAWELAILETELCHDYVTTVCGALDRGDSTESQRAELWDLVSEVLKEAAGQIRPLIESSWNDVIVKILTAKCSGPLAAVKGVAATYRMTNRPPPTQASPFVATILRPLKELNRDFVNRTPIYVGHEWKRVVVATIADRYAVAVEELIATVQRTEVALQSRRAVRRTAAGGMSDGDKVKLQLYLDFKEFSGNVTEVGVDSSSIAGIAQLASLTNEAEQLLHKQNGK